MCAPRQGCLLQNRALPAPHCPLESASFHFPRTPSSWGLVSPGFASVEPMALKLEVSITPGAHSWPGDEVADSTPCSPACALRGSHVSPLALLSPFSAHLPNTFAAEAGNPVSSPEAEGITERGRLEARTASLAQHRSLQLRAALQRRAAERVVSASTCLVWIHFWVKSVDVAQWGPLPGSQESTVRVSAGVSPSSLRMLAETSSSWLLARSSTPRVGLSTGVHSGALAPCLQDARGSPCSLTFFAGFTHLTGSGLVSIEVNEQALTHRHHLAWPHTPAGRR